MQMWRTYLSPTQHPRAEAHTQSMVEMTLDPDHVSMIAGPHGLSAGRGVYTLIVDGQPITAVILSSTAERIRRNVEARTR